MAVAMAVVAHDLVIPVLWLAVSAEESVAVLVIFHRVRHKLCTAQQRCIHPASRKFRSGSIHQEEEDGWHANGDRNYQTE